MAKKRTTTKSTKATVKSQPKAAAKKCGECTGKCATLPLWSRVASQVVDFFKKAYAKVVASL